VDLECGSRQYLPERRAEKSRFMPALLLMVTVLSVRSVPLSGSNSAYVLRRKMSWLAECLEYLNYQTIGIWDALGRPHVRFHFDSRYPNRQQRRINVKQKRHLPNIKY
jgi:hypothetical protein